MEKKYFSVLSRLLESFFNARDPKWGQLNVTLYDICVCFTAGKNDGSVLFHFVKMLFFRTSFLYFRYSSYVGNENKFGSWNLEALVNFKI